MAIRRGVLDKRYIFEYDVGQWAFGSTEVLKERASGELKTCKTVPRTALKGSGSDVLARLGALRGLQHPHICSVTDVLEDRDNFYIISEFTQGGDVQDWMERLDEGNWLQEQTCAAYIRQAVLALGHSHAASVYHRDLRPSNLSLTTKLPDAIVKVSDIGLAVILDPDNAIIQKHPTAYTAPEVLKSSDPVRSGAPDMWSVGVIAHALLVGRAPAESGGGLGASWGLARRIEGAEDDGWSERSAMSRDFVQRLLRPAGERPTAAKALQHPWLRGLQPLAGTIGSWRADADAARDAKHKALCYTLAVLLLPVVVPYRDFEQLRIAFHQSDADHDGFVPRAVGQRLLLGRCNFKDAVAPALSIVDVGRTDTLDLCGAACADLIVREFFAAGPTSAPLLGPFGAADLAPRLLRRFFEAFGDRRSGAAQPSVSVAGIKSRLRTATTRDVEAHAGVRYDDLLTCLPEERSIDGQLLTTHLSASAGRGTPLGMDGALSPLKAESPWGKTFGLDVISIFQSCSSGFKRDDSPHSIRIF